MLLVVSVGYQLGVSSVSILVSGLYLGFYFGVFRGASRLSLGRLLGVSGIFYVVFLGCI